MRKHVYAAGTYLPALSVVRAFLTPRLTLRLYLRLIALHFGT
jgi:hypothetical protein